MSNGMRGIVVTTTVLTTVFGIAAVPATARPVVAWAVQATPPTLPPGEPVAAPREADGLRPDPLTYGSPPPEAASPAEAGLPSAPPASAGVPAGVDPADWNALLASAATYGVRQVDDESGLPVVTSDGLPVLAGGPDGTTPLRAWGADVQPADRPGVFAVRRGGRLLAWYVIEEDTAAPSPAAPGPTPWVPPAPPVAQVTVLPRTGSSPAADAPAIALGGGLVLLGALMLWWRRRADARR